MIHRSQNTHVYHLLRISEMKKLFWERSLDSFAVWLVGLFVPIYLMRSGYSLTEVLVFCMLSGIVMTFFTPIAFKCITKLGANHTIILGNIFNALFFFFLYALPHYAFPLWALAIARAGYSAFYFPAFTANFVVSRSHKRTGAQIGKLNAITLFLHGVAPAIGGFIAASFGFNWLYGIAVVIICVANAPLLLEENNSSRFTFNFNKIPWNKSRDFLANGLLSISNLVESVMWPIGLSLFIVSYSVIGVLSSFMIIVAICVSLYVGKKEDKVGERRYIKQGIVAGILGSIAKLFAATPAGVMGVNLLSGTSQALLANSFTSRYYKNADNEGLLEYTCGMELAHGILWATFFAILAIASLFVSAQLVVLLAIVIAIPSLYGINLIRD